MAKNVVAAGLADRCQLQVAYAIGVAHPMSLTVDCFGTEEIPWQRIEALIQEHFDLRPGAIIRDLDLLRPIYAKTASYGHFGRDDRDFTLGAHRQGRCAARRGRARGGSPAPLRLRQQACPYEGRSASVGGGRLACRRRGRR